MNYKILEDKLKKYRENNKEMDKRIKRNYELLNKSYKILNKNNEIYKGLK